MSNPPPQPNLSPLQRLRRWLARPRGGDVIVANVGSGASDVVVGKNILKIGTLVIPALPAAIALIAALFGAGAGLWLYLVPGKMPPGRFNVAVAEFGVVDAQGRARAAADGQLIDSTLFATIQGELQNLAPDYPALVWHDSMSLLQKRAAIGLIAGPTPEERSRAACQRAADLNADIIVYGALETGASPARLRLQFCVRNTTRDRDMGNLDELQQVDRLGSPLPVDLPLVDVPSSVNPPLRVRTTLLAKLVVGLRYELASNPNFASSARRALDTFEGALRYLEQSEGAATADNGGDLVYYFIGREQFLLAQDPGTPAAEKPQRLDAARAAFGRAVELNPRYARAWSALGGAYYQRTQLLGRSRRLSTGDLAAALRAYQSAIVAAQAARDRAAEAEARLALALAYWLQADAFQYLARPDTPATEAALDQADREVAAGAALVDPAQNRLLGFAAMVRGTIGYERAQVRLRAKDKPSARDLFQRARDDYARCVAAGRADPGDQFLQRQIIAKTCAPAEQQIGQVLQGLK